MKRTHISKFIISGVFVLSFFGANAQEIGVKSSTEKDSINHPKKYGLRMGMDLWGLARDKIYGEQGRRFLFTADYRLKKNLYVYAAIGRERKTIVQEFYTFQTSGDFFKIGANLNVYNNWLSMDNEIYFGMRYAVAFFQHHLESYQIFQRGTTINKITRPYFPSKKINKPRVFKGLNAHWLEFVLGVQTKMFSNFYFGIEFGISSLLADNAPKQFANLYIPGFNTVFESSTGAGFQYTISYRIPFFKR